MLLQHVSSVQDKSQLPIGSSVFTRALEVQETHRDPKIPNEENLVTGKCSFFFFRFSDDL